ncbi:NADH-quinone oxidoreductase subunit NuoH [SAR202 cluster bacterium AD-804-J14_MRT_500m]|nr:NADH-quinone oxidoreductase subunit NuoH [SAR202 cluster bacterium AD-804-J14_MRT_500m]
MGGFLEHNVLYRGAYCWFSGNPDNAGWCGGRDGIFPLGYEWAGYFVAGFAIMFILVNGALLGAAAFVWAERRLLARFQARRGPNRWGPFGLLQPIADLLKLLTKEDLMPTAADKIVFTIVPIVMLMSLLLSLAVIPFGRNTYLVNLNIGILYFVAVGSISTIAIFMAGWSSGNRYAMFGAMRGVAMLISYEIPLVLSLAGVVLIAGSMSVVSVVEVQTLPLIVVQPLGAFLFFMGISAELNRTPFDIMEAESEIIAGYHTEYSGIKFALIQAAEMAGVLAASAMLATLFLGGWSGPFLSGELGSVWFLLKLAFFVFLFIWIRGTFPRLRIDQIMAFAWKFLLPLAVINLLATAVEVYFFGYHMGDDLGVITRTELGYMAAINVPLAIISIIAFGRATRETIMVPPVRFASLATTTALTEAD